MKIVNIGWQSANPSSHKIFYCSKVISAILLLEKILRGQLFVDYNLKLIKKKNVRLMIRLLDAYENEDIINSKKQVISNEEQEFYIYCQKLFNAKISRSIDLKLNNENNSYGQNITWINVSELNRLPSQFNVRDRITNLLNAKSVNNPAYYLTSDTQTFVINQELMRQFKALEVNASITLGDVFEIIHKGNRFTFEFKLHIAHPTRVDYCAAT